MSKSDTELQTRYYEHLLTKLHNSPHLDNPKWEQAQNVHDWRNYVTGYIKSIWHTLDNEARAAIALVATEDARNEDWD